MKYSTKNNILRLGDHNIEFPFKISHIERFREVLIVITDYHNSEFNENVWGFNLLEKIILWQIPKVDKVEFEGKQYIGISKPYTGIQKVDEQTARLFNWEGGYYDIDPSTGKFIKNIIEFRKGKRPW